MTLKIFDLKVSFLFSPPLGRPFLRKNTNSLFFCGYLIYIIATVSLRGPAQIYTTRREAPSFNMRWFFGSFLFLLCEQSEGANRCTKAAETSYRIQFEYTSIMNPKPYVSKCRNLLCIINKCKICSNNCSYRFHLRNGVLFQIWRWMKIPNGQLAIFFWKV